jgi:hypothetical protein
MLIPFTAFGIAVIALCAVGLIGRRKLNTGAQQECQDAQDSRPLKAA